MYLTYDCALLLIHIHSMHSNSSEGAFRVFMSYDMNLYWVIHVFYAICKNFHLFAIALGRLKPLRRWHFGDLFVLSPDGIFIDIIFIIKEMLKESQRQDWDF